KPDDDGKGALPLEADEIIAGDRPHIHDLSESRANGHERAGQCTQDDAAPQHGSKDREPSLACLIPWRIVAGKRRSSPEGLLVSSTRSNPPHVTFRSGSVS